MTSKETISRNNTTVIESEDQAGQHHVTVTLHQTAIVRLTWSVRAMPYGARIPSTGGPVGDVWVTLNSGGYRTATTKRRINQVATAYGLPFRVYQDRGRWYVQGECREPGANGTTLFQTFSDGMTFEVTASV